LSEFGQKNILQELWIAAAKKFTKTRQESPAPGRISWKLRKRNDSEVSMRGIAKLMIVMHLAKNYESKMNLFFFRKMAG